MSGCMSICAKGELRERSPAGGPREKESDVAIYVLEIWAGDAVAFPCSDRFAADQIKLLLGAALAENGYEFGFDDLSVPDGFEVEFDNVILESEFQTWVPGAGAEVTIAAFTGEIKDLADGFPGKVAVFKETFSGSDVDEFRVSLLEIRADGGRYANRVLASDFVASSVGLTGEVSVVPALDDEIERCPCSLCADLRYER
jgi:hypothetical protein